MTDSTVTNGRGPGGRFGKGNSFGRGNQFAKQAHELRKALYDAVTPDDIRAAVKGLIQQARSGDIVACRELLTRVLGRPVEVDFLMRMEEIEELLAQHRE